MDGKKMENPIKMDDLVGKPTIFGNIHLFSMAKIPRFPKPVGFQPPTNTFPLQAGAPWVFPAFPTSARRDSNLKSKRWIQ